MTGNSNSCREVPAYIAGQDRETVLDVCPGTALFDAYQNLLPKVAKIRTIEQGGVANNGTGFFVEDGTHMVTSGHVAMPAREMHVSYQGKQYEAVLEKLDEVNDLAELKIIGLAADPSRAQRVGDVKLQKDEQIITLGVPGKENEEPYLSPGTLSGSNKYYNILNTPQNPSPLVRQIDDAFYSGDPTLKQIAQDVANSPRLLAFQGVRPGQSGSPIVDTNGNLVGVVTAQMAHNGSADVPFTKVQDLLAKPENRFNFDYVTSHSFKMPDVGAALSDTLGLGATTAGVLGKGRFLPAAYAGVRAFSLVGEISELGHADKFTKHDLEVNIAQDATMVAGGLAATALWSNPTGRVVGLGLMGLSLASRIVTDSQQTHYQLQSITRKNGDNIRPWGL